MSLSLLLCAQPIANVRTAQNIRYRGDVLLSSAHESWVFWEESSGSDYQIQGQKYNNSGYAAFSSPITVPTGTGSVRLMEAVATSDNGIILLLLQDTLEQSAILKVQKINSQGQAQWTDSGILVTETLDYKYSAAKLCANNLGGAFLVYRGDYSVNGYILAGLNFDGSGTNIWTAEQMNYGSVGFDIGQLLLTDAGELIINIERYTGNSFRKVDYSGTIIGSDPMFNPAAVVPVHARMLKGNDGHILIYSTDTQEGSPLLMQMMDASGNLVYSGLKQLPLGYAYHHNGNIKIAASSDGGFIIAYLGSLNEYGFERELRVQRLSANLEPIWGSENPLILSDAHSFMYLDMIVDAANGTWLTVVRILPGYRDMQVELLKLDPTGNPVFSADTISISRQEKFVPRFTLLSDKAMICWGDYNGNQISILRQICAANGELLLAADGAQIRSLLSGYPDVYGVYSLGDKTICLMQDDRGLASQIYFQILDSNLDTYLPENGQALDPSEDRQQTIAAAKVSPQNTLFVFYSKLYNEMDFELYLQEIDAAGNRLYPDSGILLGIEEYFSTPATIGFEEESAYVYWNYLLLDVNPYRMAIKGQRIVAGAIQWEVGGLEIYNQPQQETSRLDAQGRYLLFSTYQVSGNPYDVKTLRIDPTGSVAANWPAEGVSVIDAGPGYNLYILAQSGIIEDDLYCFVSGIEDGVLTLKAQKLNTSGLRLWGDAGLLIYQTDGDLPMIKNLLFDDEISILYADETLGIFLQKLDTQGNTLFEGDGLRMPGNSYIYHGQQLTQFENGAYSYFWIDGPEYYQHDLKQVYINSGGSLQNIQLIHEGDLDGLYSAMCDNKAVLYWAEMNSDIFSWESKLMLNVCATALAEPVANEDITQEPVPMVSLMQNSPNPFTGSTRISYKLREASPVKIQIFNIKGQLVHELPAEQKAAGEYSWGWDGRDTRGQRCAGGIYLYKINSGSYSASKKMVLLR